MSLLVSHLTSSKLLIGLIPAAYSLGYLLPQLLTAVEYPPIFQVALVVPILGGLLLAAWVGAPRHNPQPGVQAN
jgi:hypothetical protein